MRDLIKSIIVVLITFIVGDSLLYLYNYDNGGSLNNYFLGAISCLLLTLAWVKILGTELEGSKGKNDDM